MGSKKPPAAPPSPVDTGQIQGAWNSANQQTATASANQYPQQAYDFFAPQLMSATPYGYDPSQAVSQGQQWSAQGPQMFDYANRVMQEGFDPQKEFYNRAASEQQNFMRSSQGARGVQMSPHGAGLESQGMADFGIDWRMQELQRQALASQAASQLWQGGGQAIQGGNQMQAGVPQNMLGYAGGVQQLGMNAFAPQMWGAGQYSNMFGQGTAAQQGAYKGQLDAHNANEASKGAMAGGIGKLAGTIASSAIMASDRRLKRDVHKVGDDDRGWGIYKFKYSDNETYYGYMADEVELVIPDAVIVDPETGYKSIDYGMLL